MANVEVYIGDLEDESFSWEGGKWNGNIPTRLSPFFPNGHDLFFTLVRKIENRDLEGKKVDWGCWVSRLTPGEILQIADSYYAGKKGSLSNEERLEELYAYIKGLDATKTYALTACELT